MELLILSSKNIHFTQQMAQVILLPSDCSVNVKSPVLHSSPGKTCSKLTTQKVLLPRQNGNYDGMKSKFCC